MNKYRVLIAEDEPISARYIKSIVEASGLYSVVGVCESAEDALEFLDETEIELLITDIKMTGMSGIELIQQLHETIPDAHSIIISGYADFEFAKGAIALGVSNYILKPIDCNELTAALQKIHSILEQKRCQSYQDYLHGLHVKSAQYLDGTLSLPYPEYYLLIVAGSFDLEQIIIRCMNEFQIQENAPLTFIFYRYSLLILEKCGNDRHGQLLRELSNRILIWESGEGNSGLVVTRNDRLQRKDMERDIRETYAFHQRNMVLGRLQSLPYQSRYVRQDGGLAQEKQLVSAVLSDFSVKHQKKYRRNFEQLVAFWDEQQTDLRSIKHALYSMIFCLFRLHANDVDPIIEINKAMRALYACKSYEQAGQCIAACIEHLMVQNSEDQGTPQTQSQQLYWKMIEFLNTYMDRNFTLQEISDRFAISQPYVSKLFRLYAGTSYKEYITNRKITTAIQLMEQDPSILIKDVAERVGYDQLYFSTVFYRITGEYPKQYRDNIGKRNRDLENQEQTLGKIK